MPMMRTRPRCFPARLPCRETLRSNVSLILLLMAVIALSSCSAMKVKLGMRVDLTKVDVASIDARMANSPGVAPGQKAPLIVTVTQTDGKQLQTEGAGSGKVMWKDLQTTAQVVTFDNKGNVHLAADPRASDGKTGSVEITVPSHPAVKAADLDIPFRYNVAFKANFSGADGFPGTDGMNGMDGSTGSPGSIDPNNPSPGGNGGDGTNGTDGGNGGPGGDAPPVTVRATLQTGAHPLIQFAVSAPGKMKYFLVDPNGGSLTVMANGGQGGRAGRGGRGGAGGSGGIGTPSGSSGSSGSNGFDGTAGSDGRGGLITVTYDSSVTQYLGVLKLQYQGGPKAVMQEGAVAPLW
jgi:hypothetical protein